jgi:glycosyltransferase involved in cell wall biosynthesis
VKPRAVHQLLGTFAEGDAVGNEARVFQDALRTLGFESEVFAGRATPSMSRRSHPLEAARERVAPGDVLLYHYAIGTPASAVALETRATLVLRYHNVTPAEFYAPFDARVASLCAEGRRALPAFRDRTALALPVSEFNASDLRRAGFPRIEVLPLALDESLFETRPADVLRRRLADGRRNVLFVGRLAPNKRVEDVIRAFAAYQKYAEPGSRLVLAGDPRACPRYADRLRELVDELRIEEVLFAGALDPQELVACYRTASVFLSLSAHEGYGAPLVEAMRFGVPVVALDAGAVRETLAGGGVLIRDLRFDEIGELIDALVEDESLRAAVLATQERALSRIRDVRPAAALEGAIARAAAA